MIDLSPLKDRIRNRPIAVFGLGISGMASLSAFLNAGFTVEAWDDNAEKRAEAERLGANIKNFAEDFSTDTAFLVLAPGVPLTHPAPHPVVQKARARGIEILSDIEIFHRAMPDAKTIGITGTNGKSTTTALIGHILKQAGLPVEIGGNLGKPVLAFDTLPDDGWYVIELSSYQLDLCPSFTPDIGVLLNITPDHLDRHGDMQGYAAAKARIFGANTIAICSVDDSYSRQIFGTAIAKQKIPLSLDAGIDTSDLPNLQGAHNRQNALAGYYACRAAGVSEPDIKTGLYSFPGLAHRQKIIRHIGDMIFIDDSKATNDEAAAKALSTYKNIYWIAGGLPKSRHYPECTKYFARLRHAYLIGQGAGGIAEALMPHNVPFTDSKMLIHAVADAHKAALDDIKNGKINEAVILLSPACASFDQFKNFEQRGEAFIAAVNQLPGEA